jgi:hypothetical protein
VRMVARNSPEKAVLVSLRYAAPITSLACGGVSGMASVECLSGRLLSVCSGGNVASREEASRCGSLMGISRRLSWQCPHTQKKPGWQSRTALQSGDGLGRHGLLLRHCPHLQGERPWQS